MLLANGLDDDPQAETLVSGGGDGTIKLWSLDAGANIGTRKPISLEHGDNSVLSLALDGAVLYSGRLEGEIDVWDLDTRQMIRTVKAHGADVLTLAVGHGFIFSGAANGVAKVNLQDNPHRLIILANSPMDAKFTLPNHQQVECS